MEATKHRSVTIAISDPAELRSLREHLRRIRDLPVGQTPGTPAPGEQGVGDAVEIVVASGATLAVVLRALAVFIRSRRTPVRITLRSEGREVTLTAGNVDDPQALVDRLLDDA